MEVKIAICCYELYDIHAVLLNIRSFPDNPINEWAGLCVVDVLNARSTVHEPNQLRAALSPFLHLDSVGCYQLASIQNVYTHYPLPWLKEEEVYLLMLAVFKELLYVLRKNEREQIVDLAYHLHNLPPLLTKTIIRFLPAFTKMR